MSAETDNGRTQLRLTGVTPLKRILVVTLDLGDLYVQVFLKIKEVHQSLAFAHAPIADWVIFRASDRNSIVGSGCRFDISVDEADQLMATFGPLGLHCKRFGDV